MFGCSGSRVLCTLEVSGVVMSEGCATDWIHIEHINFLRNISYMSVAFIKKSHKLIQQGTINIHGLTKSCNIRSTMSQPEWKPVGKIESLFERALAGNKWAGTNAPTAGARTERELPMGNAPFQLYSLATPVMQNAD